MSPSSSLSTQQEVPPSSSYSFTVRVPGRICLFGEHQDYLHLPVIATATPGLFCILDVTVEQRRQREDEEVDNDESQLPVIHLERFTETNDNDNDNYGDGGDTTTPQAQITIYDLNQPLPPSPPPPSTTVSSSSSYKPDFALSALHEIMKLCSRPSSDDGAGDDNDDDDDDDDLLRRSLGSLWNFRRDNLIVKCTARSPSSTSSSSKSSKASSSTSSTVSLLPIQKGVSSSTAFVTAWIVVLSQLTTQPQQLASLLLDTQPIYLAKLAHRAEVTHFHNAPGGTMDHISIAYGTYGVVRIGNNNNPWHVEQLTSNNHDNDNDTTTNNNDANEKDDKWGTWILADSGQPKDTFKHLNRCKNERLKLLESKLHGNWDYNYNKNDDDDDDDDHDNDQQHHQQEQPLTDDERILQDTTITNRDLERQAATIWRQYYNGDSNSSDETTTNTNKNNRHIPVVGQQLAQLMLQHHNALATGLQLSTERIETMKHLSLKAGAWGFKIVGSGGGGCVVVWTSTKDASRIASLLRNVHPSIQTWILKGPTQGPHIVSSSSTPSSFSNT